MSQHGSSEPGYSSAPLIKPPVWTWEIPVYFFVGGTAGMAALIGATAGFAGPAAAAGSAMAEGDIGDLILACSLIAFVGCLISPLLLVSDLGRPGRFLNMVKRFNPKSPMSMGVWILVSFSVVVSLRLALLLAVSRMADVIPVGVFSAAIRIGPVLGLLAGLLGGLLATYTGVLLAVTVVPVWYRNRWQLPVHFGFASLGSASSVLLLLGYRGVGLEGILGAAVAVEMLLWAEHLVARARSSSISESEPRLLLGSRTLLSVIPGSLLLVGWSVGAALVFPVGSLLSRFGWLEAGRVSASRSGIERSQR